MSASQRRPPPPRWYPLVVLALSLMLLTGAGIWYTNYAQRQSDRRWCELLTILAGGPAPTTERGRVIAEAMERLRRDLGC